MHLTVSIYLYILLHIMKELTLFSYSDNYRFTNICFVIVLSEVVNENRCVCMFFLSKN